MRIICTENYQEMSQRVGEIIASQIILKPDSVLGLATGSTVIGAYEYLIDKHRRDGLDFRFLHTVNLDEYIGLEPTHEQSYRYFMNHNLFDHVNIDPANTNVPSGVAEDTSAECLRYEAKIKELGGIDLQLLGLGKTCHIGFNEPEEAFATITHTVELNQQTILDNSRFFESVDEVPKQAITMGIQTIMMAKTILLAVNGEGKADALAAALQGEVKPSVPGSILQMHPNVIVVADKAALSKTKLPR